MLDSAPSVESLQMEVERLRTQLAQVERGAVTTQAALLGSEESKLVPLVRQTEAERAASLRIESERARFYSLLMDIPAGILLLRGHDMVAELVNDIYLKLVGKRDILGKALLEFFPEIAGQGFLELLRGVLETGQPFIGRDVPVLIDLEGNGTTVKRWFTFIYQPVHEPDGTRERVLVHAVDVSDHILARQALETEVRERLQAEERLQREIQERAQTEEELRSKLAIIDRQEQAILALATPILQVWEGVLALPIIGAVDSARAGRMMEGLLHEITRTRARFAIIDLTGVDMIDTMAADHLLKLVRATGLLGSRCLVSGFSPRMSQTLVSLNVPFDEMLTFRTLETALRYAIRHLGATSASLPERKSA